MYTYKSSRHISHMVACTKKMTWYKSYRNIVLSNMSWGMIDGVALKGKRIIIPNQLQMQILGQ